ncbi:hypothetical protein [Streptomyces sp. NPDC046685]|uniref:hypothetical protein n=1 Tax=Streptomyces sp. NPDC046685 TaxID=3157202 RepID=UPI0033F5F41A
MTDATADTNLHASNRKEGPIEAGPPEQRRELAHLTLSRLLLRRLTGGPVNVGDVVCT